VWICSASGSPVSGSSASGGADRVGLQLERGFEVRDVDVAGAVEQRVDEREADDVGFGAGAEQAGDSGLGLGEVPVGVVPARPGGR